MQPQINPYMQRVEQLQQFQQNMQPHFPTLGKMVESVEIVKATDIPMDGNMYYFPKADGTELYSKQWLPNGQTRILTFKPILDDEPNNSTPNTPKDDLGALERVTSVFNEKFNELNLQIEDLKQMIVKNPSTKNKKEVADE